jgi:hypothetical protein
MIAAPNPAQSESSEESLPVKSLIEVPNVDPPDLRNDRLRSRQPAFRKRVPLPLTRFLITFSIGVAATLAWQRYGDAAIEMLASSFPQLRWLTSRAEPAAQNASDTIALVAPAAAPPSPDQQQVSAISLDLDAVRQSIDRVSRSQEQMIRNVDQLAAGQAQMTEEITKLQAFGQYILSKTSESSPPAAPGSARSRSPRPSHVPTALTPARNP